jgi:hypothetical protein
MRFLPQLTAMVILSSVASTTGLAGHYCGPYTVIPHTAYSVRGSTPECAGKVQDTLQPIADAARQHGGERGQQAADYIIQGGDLLSQYIPDWPRRYQTNANCVPVCVSYPSNEQVISDNIFWDPQGGQPDMRGPPYVKQLYGQWGPGPGWHRIDPQPIIQSQGSFNLYCHIFSNWSNNINRSAIQCVDTR